MILGLAAVARNSDATAQSLSVLGPLDRYLRVVEITREGSGSSWTVRPISSQVAFAGVPGEGHPWASRFRKPPHGEQPSIRASLDEVRLDAFLNSRHPRGQHDGAVWQGKGLTSAMGASGQLAWNNFSITVDPTVIFTQNKAFELAASPDAASPFAYPWRRIDLPQRFGTESFWKLEPGQTQLAFDWRKGRISVGTENVTWGPALRNPIVLGASAPGFHHASVGTNRPLDVGIGTLEGQWLWGRLQQSDYFDPDLRDTGRFFTGLVLSYSPDFLPGLTVGGTRAFQLLVPSSGLPASELLLAFQGLVKAGQVSEERPDGSDDRDQLLSVFSRWVLPKSGFEAWIEWARNDHAWDLTDLLLEPEHSSGYTIGFQKATSVSRSEIYVLMAEATRLEAAPTFQVRPRPTFYEHGVVTQGYTHRGQLLGAAVGPGGNAQFIAFDMYALWGSAGLFFQRQVHDNDAYWVWAEQSGETFDKHDVSFDFGGRAAVFVDEFEVSGSLAFTRELNRYFSGPKVNNLNIHIGARWRPGLSE